MEIKEAVELIDKKLTEHKDAVDKKMEAALKEAKDAIKEAEEKHEREVKELVEKMTKSGATLGEMQEAVKELKMKNGRLAAPAISENKGLRKMIMSGVEDALRSNADEIKASETGSMMKAKEIKSVANISSSNLSGDNYISYLDWQPGMEPTGQFHFRNLVRTIFSATDFVQFPRANTPIGEGSFGRQASEGATKQQVDRDYTMIDLTLKAMAAYTITSRQSLRNIIFLQSWLPGSLMDQMEDSEDTDFANVLVAAASGSTSTTRTVVPEKLITYLKTLIKSKYNPNGIAVDPDVWEDILVFRPGTDNPYSLPSGGNQPIIGVTAAGAISVLGRPLYPVNWLTGRRIIAGDWTRAAIVQSEGLTLRQSDSHASIFTSNEVAFLLERTEGLAIFRTNAFITTTV